MSTRMKNGNRSVLSVGVTAFMAVWALAGCRDATEPPEVADRLDESRTLPLQLTFSESDDRAPAWDPNSGSILYSTEGYRPFSEAPGLLMRIPSGGGEARQLLPDVQVQGASSRYTAPVLSPDGSTVAFVDLWAVANPPDICLGAAAPVCTMQPDGLTTQQLDRRPRLSEYRVRVRELSTVGPIASDPFHSVEIPGFSVQEPGPLGPNFQIRNAPAHQELDYRGVQYFRPDWSPDGSQVAYALGINTVIFWTPGSEPISVLPEEGTDPMSVSWSSDGQWVAFTRVERALPIGFSCEYALVLGGCQANWLHLPILSRSIAIMRPDGSDYQVLWPGTEPDWTPDGRIVFVGEDGLEVGDPATDGPPVSIPGTEGAREPAVSPDGGRVAASVEPPGGGPRDIWVFSLGGSL